MTTKGLPSVDMMPDSALKRSNILKAVTLATAVKSRRNSILTHACPNHPARGLAVARAMLTQHTLAARKSLLASEQIYCTAHLMFHETVLCDQ
ncbi:hypothetical protein BgiMline_035687 [Biomphalaria glabrata]|nr:hypothetical protein BgiMline_030986 [Biomphalaria glabrata]